MTKATAAKVQAPEPIEEAPQSCPFAGSALPKPQHFTEVLPSMPGAISGIASAHASMIYFEGAPFASEDEGVGRITLTTCRQIGMLADGKTVANDFMVVAHLRGSLPSLARLRDTIDKLLLHVATAGHVPN